MTLVNNFVKQSMSIFGNAAVAPEEKVVRICLMCFEAGATKRKCCNAAYCDHCYTKNKLCPNCDTATRLEKMTGATFVLNTYSEHEECRICLDPGLKRRCCGQYYCDDCYYGQPKCRSCEAEVGNRGLNLRLGKASICSILLGWTATIFVGLIIAAFVMTMSASEAKTPIGMSYFKCYGLFRHCDLPICIDLPSDVAMKEEAMPALSTWQYCNSNSVVKMQSMACVFDEQLYGATATHMGFDICYDSFPNGVYIFEDTFELWTNVSMSTNTMKSATWDVIINGHATGYCGVGNTFGGSKALTFSGAVERYASTKDLDVSSGGWLEAELFIAPIGFDVTHPECKSSYAAGIEAQYSVDYGGNWTRLKHFDAWTYRQQKFFPVKFDIPEHAQTKSTRFRFIQTSFDVARDAWALDNVKVLKYLPPNWHTVAGFKKNLVDTYSQMQHAQCCFDTDWCETRLSSKQMEHCNIYPWYRGRIYQMRGAELYIVVIVLVACMKVIYICVMEWLIDSRVPLQDEIRDLANVERLYKLVPPRYRPRKNLEDYTSNIHMSARLAAELRDAFDDGEGDGDRKRKKEEEKAERDKERQRIKKEKKKLKKRMKAKNYQGTTELKEDEPDSSDEEVEEDEMMDTQFGVDKLATDMDKFKRQNVSMLRIPFDTKVSVPWRHTFSVIVLGIYVIVLLVKLATTQYYIVNETITAYGRYNGSISFTSAGIFLFAAILDFKEIYYALKNVVPARQEWVPFITIDLTDEISGLFIGHRTISLQDITEANTFSPNFIKGCAACYFLGCFPFCLFSIILRDQYLKFVTMRIVTPIFGLIMLSRCILGPGFVLKIIFSMFYFLDFDMKTRERIGFAFQDPKTWLLAVTTGGSFALIAVFLCTAVYLKIAGIVFVCALMIGMVYGAFTGCIHSLPIHPWLVMTTLEGGVWLRVKKKQRCPCIYWGKFCTEMHDCDELFVIYPTDSTKFLSIVKAGIAKSLA